MDALVLDYTQLYFTKLAAKHRKHRKQTNSKTQSKNVITDSSVTSCSWIMATYENKLYIQKRIL